MHATIGDLCHLLGGSEEYLVEVLAGESVVGFWRGFLGQAFVEAGPIILGGVVSDPRYRPKRGGLRAVFAFHPFRLD
jgi:hypothetical protein